MVDGMNTEQVERLVRFVAERLNADEWVAREAADAKGWLLVQLGPEWVARGGSVEDLETGSTVVHDEGMPTHAQAEHIARHDPARVLRDVASKRRILTEVVAQIDGMDQQIISEWGSSQDEPDESHLLLKLLAAPYDSHPGYDEAWRP